MSDHSLEIRQSNWFDSVILHVATFLFITTVLLALVQILVRQLNPVVTAVLGVSLPSLSWTVPTARFTLIVLTYIGVAVATRNEEHIGISIFLDKVEKRWPVFRKVLTLLVIVLSGAFMLIVLRGSALASITEWNTNLGSVSFISAGSIYLGISIGVAIAAYYYALQALTMIQDIRFAMGERDDNYEKNSEDVEKGDDV